MAHGARRGLVVAALFALAAPAFSQAARPPRRGPFPSRDEWLLAQPLLTLPAAAPDPLDAGRLEARIDGDWGSDFGWVGRITGKAPDLDYLVDGEHRSVALSVRRGFGRGLTLGLRVPLLWRGPGVMDGVIAWWHRTLGFPDGGRSWLARDRLRIDARDLAGRPIARRDRGGSGLGNLELEAHKVLLGRADGDGLRAALVGRLSAPTATGPFAGAGGAAGLQLVAAHPLGRRHDVYVGVGTTIFSRRALEGIEYRRTRPQGFAALEGRVTRGWSMIVQLDVMSRLVTNVESYPGGVAYLRVGSKFGLHHGWVLEGGITEGVHNMAAATDFGVIGGIARAF